ncbi:MAG: serine protease [Deltaproteobacteria bacterium]|jgi:tetratricopeptide (TPR) repeat protein|nr:serine protease [Deltaproteobacteria bacterium]
MKLNIQTLVLTAVIVATSSVTVSAANLTELVKSIQPAVATVVAYDVNNNVANIGTGFFVNKYGHLITNHHVLIGKFGAEIRTADGSTYRIRTIVAENQETDLIKVSVDIPPEKIRWLTVSDEVPPVAEQVVVVGSPMGLEQSVSDGIVSSVREIPGLGTFFQMSAPISPGSSGSPVVNMKGKVVGVASFQFLQGQNLNFAVSSKSIRNLKIKATAQSLSEWTFSSSDQKPRLAAELCRKGYSLSINGQDQKALQYFKLATENDPGSTTAWYGLGYCYAGKNSHNEAIAAYKQAIKTNPANEMSHYHLGNYYSHIGRYDEAIASYQQVVALNPKFEAAYFNLGMLLNKMGRYDEGRQAFESVIRINPQAQKAYYNIGVTYTKLGRYELAAMAYQKAIDIQPEFPEAIFNLGVVYGELGNVEDEMKAYKKAIRVNPDFAPAHLAMGQAFLRQGDKAAALDEYKILKKLDDELAEMLFEKIYR